MTGLEPAHLSAPEPKSGVSANFTTPAYNDILTHLFIFVNIFIYIFAYKKIFDKLIFFIQNFYEVFIKNLDY